MDFVLLAQFAIILTVILDDDINLLKSSKKKKEKLMNFYEEIKEKFCKLIKGDEVWSSRINVVNVRPLTSKEAIGNPERDDFPLIKGKEVMIQADFRGSLGQAFTDMPGNYSGTLREVFEMPLTNNLCY